MYHCNRTTTIVRDDMGTPYDVYGVIVRGEDGATIFSAEDLTFHRSDIDAFICNWNLLQPEPIHFQDIIEDFIEAERL